MTADVRSQLSADTSRTAPLPISDETRAWVETALSRWNGDAILLIGLSRPEVAAELTRRGASVVGYDRDASRVAGARTEARRGRFDVGSYESLHSWRGRGVDAVLFETLPPGAEITLALEAALAVSRRVIVPAEEQHRLPDRFAVLVQETNPGAGGGFVALHCYVLSEEPAESSAPCINGRLLGDDSQLSTGERSADEGFVAVLERCVAPGAGEALAIVRDRGFRPGAPDATVVAMRDPQCVASVVAAATRTDRFSREHAAVLSQFSQVWVPCAFQRAAAIRSGLDPASVTVVPDAVDTNRFLASTRRHEGFRVLAMASGPHRVEEALRAARAFALELGEEPEAFLTIVCGPGVEIAAFENRLETALSEIAPHALAQIEVRGAVRRDEIAELYGRFDLFLRPSTGERRAIAILESMACGVPVAATRYGIAAELVHEANGYPIEIEGLAPCDPTRGPVDEAGMLQPVPKLASIRAALRAAYEDGTGHRARATAARETAALRHSPQAVAARIPFTGLRAAIARLEPEAPAETEDGVEPQLSEVAGDLAGLVHFDGGDGLPPAPTAVKAAHAAREVWCSTPLSRQAWLSAGLPQRRVHIPPATVDTKIFHPGVRPAVLPTRKRFRILTSASGDLLSGADLAVRVFTEAKLSQAALLVIGAKPETKRLLTRLAEALDPAAEVGFVAEPTGEHARASLVSAADLWLDCSRVGSDGGWILESAACGKPALAYPPAIPEGTLSVRTGYPLPARPRVYSLGDTKNPTILFDVWIEEAATLLRRAFHDSVGRADRGARAVAHARRFTMSRFAAWVTSRRTALTASEVNPNYEIVAPAGSILPNVPAGIRVHLLEGDALRGGFAGEANDLAPRLESDVVVFVSGSIESEPQWSRRAAQALRDDSQLSIALAKDDQGALLAVRTSVLRVHSFAEGFRSGATLVDFARQVVQAGGRAATLPKLGIRFAPDSPRFTEEAHAVECLAAAQEAFAGSRLGAGLDCLHKAISLQPRYKAAYETAAHLFEAAELPTELRNALEGIAKLAPRDPVAHARLGVLLETLGSREASLAHLRVAHELAPDEPLLSNRYADALRAAGRARESAEVYLHSLQAAPDGLEAAIGMAEALSQLGQSQDALELLQSFEISPVRQETPVAVR